MSKKPKSAVEFLLPWRGRTPGHVDSALDYGVQQQLVQRHIAKFVTQTPSRGRRGHVAKFAGTD